MSGIKLVTLNRYLSFKKTMKTKLFSYFSVELCLQVRTYLQAVARASSGAETNS
jgi:hypothetical protein